MISAELNAKQRLCSYSMLRSGCIWYSAGRQLVYNVALKQGYAVDQSCAVVDAVVDSDYSEFHFRCGA